jgi:hypothetical protein
MTRKTFLGALALNVAVAMTATMLAAAPTSARSDDDDYPGCDKMDCDGVASCTAVTVRDNCFRNTSGSECITRICRGSGGGDEM